MVRPRLARPALPAILVVALLLMRPATAAPAKNVPPFLGVLLTADFSSPKLIDIEGDKGWRRVEVNGQWMYCISNYHSQYGAFPKFLFGDKGWQNYSVEAHVQFYSPDPGHIAMLTRLNDKWWGYRHGLEFSDQGIYLGQYYYGGADGGNTQDFGRGSLPPLVANWQLFRAEVDGKTIRTLLNERLLVDYNVDLTGDGFAGIEVGPGVFLCVDTLTVRSLDRSSDKLAAAKRGRITRNANIHLWPGITSKIAGVYGGEKVFLMEQQGDWLHIRKLTAPVQGWVWAKYVKPVD
jgi:hypothetical protein